MAKTATIDEDLIVRASARLMDASGMLRLEAQEWRDRRSQPPRNWDANNGEWAAKCERIAATNISAATACSETAKGLAAALFAARA